MGYLSLCLCIYLAYLSVYTSICTYTITTTEKPGKPDPPKIVEVGRSTAGLTWTPPSDDGGAPISNYVVEYRVEGGFKWVRATEDQISRTAYTVKGLLENTIYEFRIAAENKAGQGPFSEPTAPIEVYDKSSR